LTSKQLSANFKRAVQIVKFTDAIRNDFYKAHEFHEDLECPFLVAKIKSRDSDFREKLKAMSSSAVGHFIKAHVWLLGDAVYVFDSTYKSKWRSGEPFDSDAPANPYFFFAPPMF